MDLNLSPDHHRGALVVFVVMSAVRIVPQARAATTSSGSAATGRRCSRV